MTNQWTNRSDIVVFNFLNNKLVLNNNNSNNVVYF